MLGNGSTGLDDVTSDRFKIGSDIYDDVTPSEAVIIRGMGCNTAVSGSLKGNNCIILRKMNGDLGVVLR